MIVLISILVVVFLSLPKGSTFRIFRINNSKLLVSSRNKIYTRSTIRLLSSKSTSVNFSTAELSDEKKLALELLDCITSPTDSSDPQYNVEKDIRRDNLLLTNDYHDLKLEMK